MPIDFLAWNDDMRVAERLVGIKAHTNGRNKSQPCSGIAEQL